jgi:hypothetical protein
LAAFTVIVRGARGFALLVAILVLALIGVLGVRHHLPMTQEFPRAPTWMRNESWNGVRHRRFCGITPVRPPTWEGFPLAR